MRGRVNYIRQNTGTITGLNWFFLFTTVASLMIAVNSSLRLEEMAKMYRR